MKFKRSYILSQIIIFLIFYSLFATLHILKIKLNTIFGIGGIYACVIISALMQEFMKEKMDYKTIRFHIFSFILNLAGIFIFYKLLKGKHSPFVIAMIYFVMISLVSLAIKIYKKIKAPIKEDRPV